MNQKSAILVLSCDKYSSLWKPFFDQFWKYWKQCPYKIYLGTNYKIYPDKRIITVASKKNDDWTSNLLARLQLIKEEYLFIWLDDYFVTNYVDGKLFQHCFDFLISNKANHVQMTPSIPSDALSSDKLFAYSEKGAPYRVTAYGFWKKEHLMKLLLSGENPWQFEIFGSYRSSFSDGYYSLRKNLFEHLQIVERGKVFREAYEYCLKHGIAINFNEWQIRSRSQKIKSDILRFVFIGIVHIPWRVRLSVMAFFRKALASY